MNITLSVKDIVNEAIALHKIERSLTLKSTLIVGQLEEMRASVLFGLSCGAFAQMIGLSPMQYWKRAQAARVMRRFPEARAMVEKGETSVSSVAMLSARITEANCDILLPGIKGKSKREVKELLSIVTLGGEILDKEPTIDLKVTLSRSQMASLDRALEVMAAGGKTPDLGEVFAAALEALLWRRDPLQKAERARKRKEKIDVATSPAKEMKVASRRDPVLMSTATSPAKSDGTNRSSVPSAIRHEVWLRDQGQCTWHHPNGVRCGERKMLELDHRHMVCRGGTNTVENLTLRCRFHNQIQAEILLGRPYMEQKRHAGVGFRTATHASAFR